MAQNLRNHSAARPEAGRIVGEWRRPPAEVENQKRGGALKAMVCIEARGLRKAFGTTIALDGVNLRVEEGRILGLIGPNGAGKTTALNTSLGLTPYQGELNVLGRDPWTERDQLMRDVSFIADVAVLPRWMRVSQALDFVAGVHPRFDRAKAEGFLVKTNIGHGSKIRELSKGMVTQLHLALVMAMDAKLLVLDEPTLGLDILFRKQFYDSLLNDYFDRSRTIVVTTHQVEEIQDVLTDVMFINRGRIIFDCSMEEFETRYLEVMVNPEQIAAARALKPIHERQVFGRSILLFDRVEQQDAAPEHLAFVNRLQRPCGGDLLGIPHHFQIARLEFFHAAIEHDAAAVNEHDIGQDVLNLFHLMGGHHDGAASIEVVIQQRIVELLAIQNIQAKSRLVQHQQFRVNGHD